MRNLTRWAALTAILAVGVAGMAAAVAEEVMTKEQLMEKSGLLRGRLLAKLPEVAKAVDMNQNGGQALYSTAMATQSRVSQAISQAMAAENAKDPESRSQDLLAELTKKSQKLGELYTEFTQVEWPALSKKMSDQNQMYGGLQQVFGSIGSLENPWMNSGLDLGMLVSTLSAIDRQADEIKSQATTLIADAQKGVLPKWEALEAQ